MAWCRQLGQVGDRPMPPSQYRTHDHHVAPDRRPTEGIQNAGDITIVPAGWSHLILNLKTSVGVAQEFASSSFADYT